VGSVLDPTLPIDIGERSQRHRIVEAMIECCAEKTYAATTIADLVSHASISRTTFYKRFDGKRECFDAALDYCIDRVRAVAVAAISPADPLPVAVGEAANAALELMAAEPPLAQVLVAEAVSVDPTVIGRYRKLVIPPLEALWQRDGEEGQESHTDPRLAFGQAQVLIFNHVVAGQAEELPTLLPEIVYIALLPFAGHEQALQQAQLAAGGSELSPKAQ
jgi:AcrR family transcriptional regulator